MAKLKLDSDKKFKPLRKIAKAVYSALGQKDNLKAEITFVSATQIQDLNRETRNIDKITDVLSYPSLEGIKNTVLSAEEYSTLLDGKYLFIGSIALCEQKIIEQAKEYGHSAKEETIYLIVHGLMHLFGYDHMTDEDKKEMREKEKLALARLGIKQ